MFDGSAARLLVEGEPALARTRLQVDVGGVEVVIRSGERVTVLWLWSGLNGRLATVMIRNRVRVTVPAKYLEGV